MTAKLIAEEGILKGQVLSFEAGEEWVIGRDPEQCEFTLEDPSTSRRHLLCRTTAEGFQVENLSATNPIHVNQEEIEAPRVLHHGDEIVIGGSVWRFYQEIAAQIENGEIEEDSAALEQDPATAEKTERDTVFEEEEETDLDEPSLAEVDFDLSDTNPWLLKVIDGPNNGAEFSMQSDASYILGSDPTKCDIVFHDVSVSRNHSKLIIAPDGSLRIEDLNSSNGTVIDGKAIEDAQAIEPNTLVSLGTTTFVVFNREDEQHTVISPLLPAIVKVLQKEEDLEEPSSEKDERKPTSDNTLKAEAIPEDKTPMGTLVLLSVITGLFLIIGMGTALLFRSEEIVTPHVNTESILTEILSPHEAINSSFNKTTGRLLLIGHVLTAVERNQLLYDLDALSFVHTIDDNVIVDEFIWQETNQVLSKNTSWKGVAIHSPAAGRFVLSGYLTTRKQAEDLSDYMNKNFPYLELLERRIIVEEEIITQINTLLRTNGIRDVAVAVINGEVTLSGNIGSGQRTNFETIIEQISEMQGVRILKNFVAELEIEEAVINISDNYPVSGSSTQNGEISVFIKGRILSKNDILDGMRITEIRPGAIFLEKDGVKYRIDY